MLKSAPPVGMQPIEAMRLNLFNTFRHKVLSAESEDIAQDDLLLGGKACLSLCFHTSRLVLAEKGLEA